MPEIASTVQGFESGVQHLDTLSFLGLCPSSVFDDGDTQPERVFLINISFVS